MWTQKQRIKLILMTGHEKYGQLLADAYNTWINENNNPIRFRMNFESLDAKYCDKWTLANNKCCLQGAAIANKNSKFDAYSDIGTYYETSFDEVSLMRQGFDTTNKQNLENETEAFKFGYQVGKIVFNEYE